MRYINIYIYIYIYIYICIPVIYIYMYIYIYIYIYRRVLFNKYGEFCFQLEVLFTFSAFSRKSIEMVPLMSKRLSAGHSLLTAAFGTFSLPESHFVSTSWTVFLTQAGGSKSK